MADPDTIVLLRNLLAVPTFVVYVAVGYVVGQRAVSLEVKAVNRAFQAWWYGLAVLTLFTPAMYLLGLAGLGGFGVRLFVLEFLLIAIVVAIGCLVYYLLYVYTGKPWVFWPVAAYHMLILTWLMYLVTIGHPVSYGPECPNGGFCYENDFASTPASTWLVIALIVPILLGALAYFVLYFRVDGREQKYRIALVAGSLILWFGSSLVATLFGLAEKYDYWPIVSTIIGLLASIVILLAYRPPRWFRARLGTTH